jgi:hypothetical protein
MIIERTDPVKTAKPERMMLSAESERTPRRSLFVIALTLLAALQAAPPVWAWGRLGHRLTARIAERNLNPKARAVVKALLEEGESMADASTWADEHRRDIKGSGPWHYVDVRLDEPRYDARFSGPDPRKGCVVDKLMEFVNILGDPARPVEERRVALRFVIHLVGDLHQPLHVGNNGDRGGTTLRFGSSTAAPTCIGCGIPASSIEPAGMRTDGLPNSPRWTRPRPAPRRCRDPSRIGRRNPCWPPGEPTRTPRPACGSGPARGWGMPTRMPTCRSFVVGSIRGGMRLAMLLNDVLAAE